MALLECEIEGNKHRTQINNEKHNMPSFIIVTSSKIALSDIINKHKLLQRQQNKISINQTIQNRTQRYNRTINWNIFLYLYHVSDNFLSLHMFWYNIEK